jgi:cytochrome b561
VAARVTDWGLAALLAALAASGALTLFAGASADAWVFDAHDALGIAIVLLLAIKLRRVWPRLINRARHDRRTPAGALAIALSITALITGFLWAAGVTPSPGRYSLLAWHDTLGAVLVVSVAVHMSLRAKPLRRRDLAHRREFLTAAGIAAGSFLAWRTQRPLEPCSTYEARAGASPARTTPTRSPATHSRRPRGWPITRVRSTRPPTG